MCHYRQDADLNADFPTKNGDAVKKMSVCLWFRADTVPGVGNYDSLVSKFNYSGSKISWDISMDDSKLKFVWGYGSGTDAEKRTLYATPATGRWYHVGIALDGVTKSLYYKVWDDTAGAVVARIRGVRRMNCA